MTMMSPPDTNPARPDRAIRPRRLRRARRQASGITALGEALLLHV